MSETNKSDVAMWFGGAAVLAFLIASMVLVVWISVTAWAEVSKTCIEAGGVMTYSDKCVWSKSAEAQP